MKKLTHQSGIAEVALVVGLLGVVLAVGGIAFYSLNNTTSMTRTQDATPRPLPTDRVPDEMENEEPEEVSSADDLETLETELDATIIDSTDNDINELEKEASSL